MTQPSPEAISEAGWVLAQGTARRDSLTPEEAARAAHVPGGPSVDELAARIRSQRARSKGDAA